MTGVVSWIGTWVVMIMLLVLLAKFNWGRTVVYWLLWLAVLFLVLTHADEIGAWINPQALALNG